MGLKDELTQEKVAIDQEQSRLEAIEAKRLEGEKSMMRRQQENLFRQMDYQQVARQRRQHQEAIEKRQSAMAENKISRAVEKERLQSTKMMTEILENRNASLAAKKVSVAPWDK